MADPLIAHIDMDAFFASVEQMDHPETRGKPVVVGGRGPRSVVSAASYEARRFGVRSAMPMATALRLCPKLVVMPGRMSRYKEISRQVMAVLARFSPLVEQASVDEAYLDLTGSERLFGTARDIGAAIKAQVREATGLTCSYGAAPAKFLAKIASDLNKPDGLTVIEPGEVAAFMAGLPIGKIPGIGAKSLEYFARMNVRTAGDILRHPESFWLERLGERGRDLCETARGQDRSKVTPFSPPKSSSAEHTFDADVPPWKAGELKVWLLRQAERVGRDLRGSEAQGRTVTLKVRYADFSLITRSRSLPTPTASTRRIHEVASALLDALDPQKPIRLIGVGVSNLTFAQRQLSLLPDPEARREDMDRAADAVREKFGSKAIVRAETLTDEEKREFRLTTMKTDKTGGKPGKE